MAQAFARSYKTLRRTADATGDAGYLARLDYLCQEFGHLISILIADRQPVVR